MNERILIIDDDRAVHEVASAFLEREGYIVYSATEGRDGLGVHRARNPALLILDRILPDISGEAVLRAVRLRSQVPVVMISGSAGTDERLEAFALGADDYLTKPFSPRELVARVKANLRRQNGQSDMPSMLAFDGGRLEIDTIRHEVRVEGRPLCVTSTEYNLLLALAQQPGRVYSRSELVYRARGHDFEGYERSVDAHIKNLRRKVEEDPTHPRYVETVRGVGYRLGVEPT
jgi:DNA-binding response OmpR family regulator